jgi:DNA ligase-1
MALFRDLVKVASQVTQVSGKKEKVRLLAEFLEKLSLDEVAIAARFLAGEVFPEYDMRELGVGYSLLKQAYGVVSHKSILPISIEPLSITEVYRTLERIANVAGGGSKNRKIKLLQYLFSRMDTSEIDFLLRVLFGEVRIGASKGLLLEAASKIAGVPISDVLHAYMVLSDVGDVVLVARENPPLLGRAELRLFHPVKPMLADMAYSVDALFQEHGSPLYLEYKYDGIRVQIHINEERVEVFSRRLNRITEFVPDVVEKVRVNVKAEKAILDGEALAIIGGKPVAFQDLLKRVRRKNEREKFFRELPFQLHLFDVIYLNGRTLVKEPYTSRRNILQEIVVDDEILAKLKAVYNKEEAQRFYEEALKEKHEGIMSKRATSLYKPGIRGSDWLKLKSYDTIDCVIIAAEWGHGRRRGWLSNYHLGVFDEKSGKFLSVGKTFKGLGDAEFEEMTRRLLQLKIWEDSYTVYVKPAIVVEVDYSEIQRSKRYPSGFALRFARIRRIRFDKQPEDATTLSELKRRYLERALQKTREGEEV